MTSAPQLQERDDDHDLANKFRAPPTFLNHLVSPVRRFATATLSLAEIKETAKQLGVTFNDVVLATAAGGLRELLLRYDGRADGPSSRRCQSPPTGRRTGSRATRSAVCRYRFPYT